jgi:hypothetical protein
MDQERLFRLAVEALTVSAHRDGYGRWHIALRARRGDEGWQDGYWASYELLTSAELVDVLAAELDRLFGL